MTKKKAVKKRKGLDPVKDFDTPTRKPIQQSLCGDGEEPGPPLVVNGRMLAEYVKPHFTRDKNNDRYLGLQFSMKLNGAHEIVLPKTVLRAWDHLKEGGQTLVGGIEIKPQTVRVYLAPDIKDEELLIVGGVIANARVQIVEERGKGEAVKYTRFSFRVVHERSKNLLAFADWNDGNTVWLEMKQTQASMGGE